MTRDPAWVPLAAVMGIPITLDGTLWDGDVLVVRHPFGGTQALVIGVRQLTWVERSFRSSARRHLANVYRWLGEPVPNPNPMPGRELVDRIRRATDQDGP